MPLRFHSIGNFLRLHYPGLIAAYLAAVGIFNTIFNNAYFYGATLYDSSIFATIIWRSGWALKYAPALHPNYSFFSTHIAFIEYIPNLLSYIFPYDFMLYYGLVYGLTYAALIFTCYWLINGLITHPAGKFLAALGALMFFCSQIIFYGSWEMHEEVLAPLFVILAFRAWQLERYYAAFAWFALNTLVREDTGALSSLGFGLLVAHQFLTTRQSDPQKAREILIWGAIIASLSIYYSLIFFSAPRLFVPPLDLLVTMYFHPLDPFGHLTTEVLMKRAHRLFFGHVGLWLPLVALAIASVKMRDRRLLIGAVCYLPYSFIMFLSLDNGSATMEGYKSFPYIVCLMWPSLMALDRPINIRKKYVILQFIVLTCGLGYNSSYIFKEAAGRWILRPQAEHREPYEEFGKILPGVDGGKYLVSEAVLALYPHLLPVYWQSAIRTVPPKVLDNTNTFIWFKNDRSSKKVQKILASDTFATEEVPGTRIFISRRLTKKP